MASTDRTAQTAADTDPTWERRTVERARQGDRDAFDALMRAYGELVFGVIGGLVRDPDERADLFQETFLRAYRGLDRFDPAAPLRPWLVTIALNAARDHLRSRGRWSMVSLDDAGDDGDAPRLELDAPGPAPDLVAIGRDAEDLIERAFSTLPETARAILWLRVREELSYDEIAQVLDIPRGTVMSRLARARSALLCAVDAMSDGAGDSALTRAPRSDLSAGREGQR